MNDLFHKHPRYLVQVAPSQFLPMHRQFHSKLAVPCNLFTWSSYQGLLWDSGLVNIEYTFPKVLYWYQWLSQTDTTYQSQSVSTAIENFPLSMRTTNAFFNSQLSSILTHMNFVDLCPFYSATVWLKIAVWGRQWISHHSLLQKYKHYTLYTISLCSKQHAFVRCSTRNSLLVVQNS